MKDKVYIILLILLGLVFWVNPHLAYAHGASVKYESVVTYKIEAKYDSGTPIDNAQVLVYAPDNPAKVWAKGQTDKKGIYILTPDLSKTGSWLVQIRKAGHGASVNIQVEDGKIISGDTGLGKGQTIIMAISVVWGFVGTALYFSRRKG